MPISIAGSGTITGISAGGLPDNCITTAEIAANAVTTAKLGTNEASGLAKAWVNFNGTGTVAIRASYNVSSITDNGVGDYTVNFTTAMVDANYCPVGMGRHVRAISSDGFVLCFQNTADDGTSGRTTGSLRVSSHDHVTNFRDSPCVFVAIFR